VTPMIAGKGREGYGGERRGEKPPSRQEESYHHHCQERTRRLVSFQEIPHLFMSK